MNKKIVLAFVGMPGSGKSEATVYLEKKGIPFVRFGNITDDGLESANLPLTPENEQNFREKIRKDFGMNAYAVKSWSQIEEALRASDYLVLDGLYSWEEYKFLKEKLDNLILIHLFVEAQKRYQRLSQRKVRPVPLEKCYLRDIKEIENLNKAGPIAIADYSIDNNSNSISDLYSGVDALLERIGIKAK
ncbi:MAG: AAA family ATPase [Candidatus Levyibacteriota bacterium]